MNTRTKLKRADQARKRRAKTDATKKIRADYFKYINDLLAWQEEQNKQRQIIKERRACLAAKVAKPWGVGVYNYYNKTAPNDTAGNDRPV